MKTYYYIVSYDANDKSDPDGLKKYLHENFKPIHQISESVYGFSLSCQHCGTAPSSIYDMLSKFIDKAEKNLNVARVDAMCPSLGSYPLYNIPSKE